MAMKRRSFLTKIGAAIAASVLPLAGSQAPAVYSRQAFGMAVLHARTRAHISARGLMHCLKVSRAQADAMMAELASKGMVRPILGSAKGAVRAVSNILEPDTWGFECAARDAAYRQRQVLREQQKAGQDAPVLDPLIAYLRQMCVSYGMPIKPLPAMV